MIDTILIGDIVSYEKNPNYHVYAVVISEEEYQKHLSHYIENKLGYGGDVFLMLILEELNGHYKMLANEFRRLPTSILNRIEDTRQIIEFYKNGTLRRIALFRKEISLLEKKLRTGYVSKETKRRLVLLHRHITSLESEINRIISS